MSTVLVLAGMSLAMLAAGERLDMNAADDTQNAPHRVDSRFMVTAARRCSMAATEARDILLTSDRTDVRRLASTAAAESRRLGAALASVERQKGWTLPPPGTSPYESSVSLSDHVYLQAQSDNNRALLDLFEQEAVFGRDGTVNRLVRRELPALRRELAAVERVAANPDGDGSR